jgi:pyruvate/2-oxoglutarate dehydrogenase complex dihydrolipoamide dehydrogenase (E3) component
LYTSIRMMEERNGKVRVSPCQRTSHPKGFAVGDLVDAQALARGASSKEAVAVESVAGDEALYLPQGLVAGASPHPAVSAVSAWAARA